MHVPKAQQLKGRDVFLLTPHVHSIARGPGPRSLTTVSMQRPRVEEQPPAGSGPVSLTVGRESLVLEATTQK